VYVHTNLKQENSTQYFLKEEIHEKMKTFFSVNIGYLKKHEIELDQFKVEKKGIGKIKALIKADEDLMSKGGNEILDRFKFLRLC
jgi:hypothetical protein